ncbi:protein PLASTID REDOX INSENSITIVE 2, chloroplastic-like [Tasmannia lanceolata]|uniref:protein PLASTID REDOX INSENSITIVE 2, chloroplastic-like n=1 Tax=Tasmannia lanceolata TaxID=3420 RepID=UPI0040635FDD
MGWNTALSLSTHPYVLLRETPPSLPSSFPLLFNSSSSFTVSAGSCSLSHGFDCSFPLKRNPPSLPYLFILPKQICRAGEYVFPDPIPEFAEAETEKFRSHLHKKLLKKEICGDSVEEVVGICTEIFSNFMHTEYGGPGTLLVIPFIDMADTLNERGLPGGPQAARAAVVWAQKNVDKDWSKWTEGDRSTQ